MKNAEFKQKLVKLGACQDALDWVGEQEPEAAWDAAGADHFHWQQWLVSKLPSLSPLWMEYMVKNHVLTMVYGDKIDPLWAEHKSKYDLALTEDARKALWGDYGEQHNPLVSEHEAKVSALFYEILPWGRIEAALRIP